MEKLALVLPGGEIIKNPTGLRSELGTLGGFVSALLPIILVLAGLTLFILLILGGFGILTSAGSPDKMKAAQGKITSAIIGFVIIFISYWIARILEVMLGINILG